MRNYYRRIRVKRIIRQFLQKQILYIQYTYIHDIQVYKRLKKKLTKQYIIICVLSKFFVLFLKYEKLVIFNI